MGVCMSAPKESRENCYAHGNKEKNYLPEPAKPNGVQASKSQKEDTKPPKLEDTSKYISEKEIEKIYKLERVLGEGASCKVWKVLDKEGSSVALKKLSRKDGGNYKLFYREVDILNKIDHPNLVSLKNDFYSKINLYIMTELCDGGELFDHIVECRKFNEVKAAEYTKTMMSAIKYLHNKHICHRDLKPENFCLKSQGGNKKLILIDFGVAREVELNTKYKGVVGTPFYLAPEYLSRVSRDGKMLLKADIWSIGVITYIMVTGSPPFGGRNNAQIFKSIVAGVLRYPHINISPCCKKFINKLLTQDPSARPTAEQVMNDEWLSGPLTRDNSTDLTGTISMLARFQQESKLHKAINPLVVNQMRINGWEPSIKDQLEMQALFKTLDKDNDGQLTYEELKNYLSQRQGSIFGEKAAREILACGDSNADGQLSFDEYIEAMKAKVMMKDENICKRVFNILDLNNDGRLTISELCTALNISKRIANDLVHESDTEKTGYLSFDEFKATLQKEEFSISVVGNHSTTVNATEITQFIKLRDEEKEAAIIEEPANVTSA